MRRAWDVISLSAAATGVALASVSILLLFALLVWQTNGFETERADRFLDNEIRAIAHEAADRVGPDINVRYRGDLHRNTGEALFGPDGKRLAGDVTGVPPGLKLGEAPVQGVIVHETEAGPQAEKVRIAGSRLSDGSVFLVWRSMAQIRAVNRVVLRGLALGLLPGLALAVIAAYVAASRAAARAGAMHRAIQTIMHGDLHARLPVRTARDTLGMLATSVNDMLQELEHLVGEIRAAGDGMAHDLRTPLARARARLETGRARAASHQELAQVVDTAIADLDQCADVITALLRIGEIEGSARRAGFGQVDVRLLLDELAELYQPVAEAKSVALSCTTALMALAPVEADRDLLFEAMANLVDNAVKFTPAGGAVELFVEPRARGPVLWVRDTGPGIASEEREAVLRRFHRGDKARHVPGFGLGLALVAAITRLHGFQLLMEDAGGFRAGLWCRAPGPAG